MVGRTTDYGFLNGMIINILNEAPTPLQALGVNFIVNKRSGKIIGLNMILKHLDFLVKQKKIYENKIVKKGNEMNVYWATPIR